VLPDVQNLPATKRADVVLAFKKDAVLEAFPDGPWVVLDEARQFVGGEVGQ
jgi:hypothetical protein